MLAEQLELAPQSIIMSSSLSALIYFDIRTCSATVGSSTIVKLMRYSEQEPVVMSNAILHQRVCQGNTLVHEWPYSQEIALWRAEITTGAQALLLSLNQDL